MLINWLYLWIFMVVEKNSGWVEQVFRLFRLFHRKLSIRQIFILGLLSLCGLLGNVLHYELFFSVDLIFGSIATIIAVRLAGVLWGCVVAALVSYYTIVIWGHNYALYIFIAEALWIGFSIHGLRKYNIVLVDLTFWLFLGMPMVFLFYGEFMGLEAVATELIAFKQAINGLLNAAVAYFLLYTFRLNPRFKEGSASSHSTLNIEQTLSILMALFILIPAVMVTGIIANQEQDRTKQMIASRVKDEALDLSSGLQFIFERQAISIDNVIQMFVGKAVLIKDWEAVIRVLSSLLPNMINIQILDTDAHIIYGSGFVPDDIQQLIQVAVGGELVLFVGGKDSPAGSMFFIYRVGDQFIHYESSITMVQEYLKKMSHEGKRSMLLIDALGQLISTNNPDRFSETFIALSNDAHQIKPEKNKLSAMQVWSESNWVELDKQTGWAVAVVEPMKEYVANVQRTYRDNMMIMLSVVFIALLSVSRAAKGLMAPLKALATSIKMLNVDDNKNLNQPRFNVQNNSKNWLYWGYQEIDLINEQFNQMLETIDTAIAHSSLAARELEQLIDTANVPIFGIDEKGTVDIWNQTTERLTGFNKVDVIGNNFVSNFITDDFKLSVKVVLDKALRGEQTANFEFPLFTKTGNRADVLLNTTTRRDIEGRVIGVIVISQDISELKNVQEQVIQSSKLATLGEMATSAAHELNQPLNVIRMAAGNIRRKITHEPIEKAYIEVKLARIDEQTTRAAAIIDHMRMFGRKVTGPEGQFNPCEIINNALDLVGERLKLDEIDVTTAYEDCSGCGKVQGHGIQMEQVIINLLTNSRDAVLNNIGSKWIRLSMAFKDKHAEISIQDNGHGIPVELINRIFEPFYTTKEVGKGTGLGLSASYGIVHDMNGTITASNTTDGACFTIRLPLIESYDHCQRPELIINKQ
jgi:PAS domain S-box-containing protein